MDGENKIYGGQVYYDPRQGQYYTQPSVPFNSAFYGLLSRNADRNRTYLNQSPFSNMGANNQSQIQQMLANRQPYQYNAPTAAQMFGGVSAPTGGMTMPNFGAGNQGGLFGAGRFLGGNYANQAGLLGTSVSGT